MRISSEEIAGERYLQVIGKKETPDIMEKMLEKNDLPGILVPDVLELGEELYYRYQITGKESLCHYHERKRLNPGQILWFLEQLADTMSLAEEYLISANRFLFEAEYIFITKENALELCCGVESNRNICRSIENLMQFFIKRMSPGSNLEMKKVYWIYEELQKENASLCEILNRQMEPSKIEPEPVALRNEKKWQQIFRKTKKNTWNSYFKKEELIEREISDETVALGTQLLEIPEAIHRLKRIGKEMREEIPIYSYPSTLGKSKDMDLVISVPTISGRHAQFQKSGEEIWVQDLSSLNGTYVNDIRINDRVPISSGDRIRFADQEYFFE